MYYFSKVFNFDSASVLQTLKNSERTLDTFYDFLYRNDDLKHSYEKFRFSGDANKPPFEDVYKSVKEYIKDILPCE